MKHTFRDSDASLGCAIVTTRGDLRAVVDDWRAAGESIGFVPTMGALHAGHLSLVDAAKQECTRVVASIFVNPTQFGAGEDFERYPRDLQRDVAQLAPRGVDLVFAPTPAEVYRPGSSTVVEPAKVSLPLEGSFRPGHFRGVATVVLKLFNMVRPHVAFFGQKDYQQSLVVRHMVDDLDVPVVVRVCPTMREPDGLAMSSRNAYLSVDDRRRGLVLSRSLALACELFAKGDRDAKTIRDRMKQLFDEVPGVTLDYLTLADSETLAEVPTVTATTVALIAARVAGVRLIDNCILGDGMK